MLASILDAVPNGAMLEALSQGGAPIDVAEALAESCGPAFLNEAYADQQAQDGGGHDFNLSTLCCLPKKVSGVDDEKGEFYDPENTRLL